MSAICTKSSKAISLFVAEEGGAHLLKPALQLANSSNPCVVVDAAAPGESLREAIRVLYEKSPVGEAFIVVGESRAHGEDREVQRARLALSLLRRAAAHGPRGTLTFVVARGSASALESEVFGLVDVLLHEFSCIGVRVCFVQESSRPSSRVVH